MGKLGGWGVLGAMLTMRQPDLFRLRVSVSSVTFPTIMVDKNDDNNIDRKASVSWLCWLGWLGVGVCCVGIRVREGCS